MNDIKGPLRVNYQIRSPRVRLIDAEGNQVGIVTIQEAQKLASESGLDLVEVAPDANPPVCKIIDFKKYLYAQKRKQRQAKKRQHSELKEIKFRPAIDKHDYETKVRHIREFLANGYKVKVTLVYRGREKTHRELGEKLIEQILADLSDVAQVDHLARQETHIDGVVLSRKKS
ncbi:translation initiation factor IF-3 [Candidatus Sumerlaeota bacterium]|nr:translation initiation factor IF-3 [Candidatus Sumerlaeota bacterium]